MQILNSADLSAAFEALAAPFRRPGTLLRCALLPFLICLASATTISLTAGPQATRALYISGLILFLLAFAGVSLAAFSINWRRSLALGETEGALLSIDGRTLVYVWTLLFRDDTVAKVEPRGSAGWLSMIGGVFATFLLVALLMFGGGFAFIAGLIWLQPTKAEIDLGYKAVFCLLFVSFFFTRGWRRRSAVALDIPFETIDSRRRGPASLVPLLATAVLFFFLAVFFPQPEALDTPVPQELANFVLWEAALFLAIAWCGAAETRFAMRSIRQAAPIEPAETATGRGHRQFRAPVPPPTGR